MKYTKFEKEQTVATISAFPSTSLSLHLNSMLQYTNTTNSLTKIDIIPPRKMRKKPTIDNIILSTYFGKYQIQF